MMVQRQICVWISVLLLSLTGHAPAAAFHPGGTSIDTNAVESLDSALREALRAERAGSNILRIGMIELDKKAGRLCVPARVCLTNQVVEYALVTEQGKSYESLLTTRARAQDLQVALLLLGLSPSAIAGPVGAAQSLPATNALDIQVSWSLSGVSNQLPLTELVQLTGGHPDSEAGAMPPREWLFNGSLLGRSGFAATLEGSLVSLIRDPVAIVNNPGADRDSDERHFPYTKRLPPAGTGVQVILSPAKQGK